MNRKILSAAVLVLATVAAAPLAQARDGRDGWHGRDNHRPAPVYREKYVERHYYHPGRHHGWHRPRHHGHHYRPAPPRHHYYYYREPYPRHRGHSSAPIILGSVIGGVVGHEIGRGDPGHTAAGAVIGTVIGYEIVRHR